MKKLIKSLNIAGSLIIIMLILFTAPLTLPKLLGYQIYAVLSGSMEPEYPVGSVVYIKEEAPGNIQVGDVITFHLPEEANVVMTHRVVRIDAINSVFNTKGDANEQEDVQPVSFDKLIGKAVLDIPKVAIISDFINTTTGKAVCFSLFALSFIFWIVADIIKRSKWALKNKNTKISFVGIVRAVFVILILISAVGLVSASMQYHEATKEYKALQKIVKETLQDKEQNQEDTEFRPNKSIIAEFQNLRSQNPEMTAWIAFDTLNISYPVMHGVDNTYYLTHTFSGKTNSSGSIFMEAGNSGDFTDYHTLLYGHNMKNGSMFGLLKKYRDEEFYSGNEFFIIYLQDRYLRYQIFPFIQFPLQIQSIQ